MYVRRVEEFQDHADDGLLWRYLSCRRTPPDFIGDLLGDIRRWSRYDIQFISPAKINGGPRLKIKIGHIYIWVTYANLISGLLKLEPAAHRKKAVAANMEMIHIPIKTMVVDRVIMFPLGDISHFSFSFQFILASSITGRIIPVQQKAIAGPNRE